MTAATMHPFAADQRRFGTAIVASMVAHALVLALVPGFRPWTDSEPAGALQVSFLKPVIETARQVLQPVQPPPQPEVKRAPRAASPVLSRRSEPAPEPAAAPTPETPAEPAPILAAPAAAPEPAPFSVPAQPVAPPGPVHQARAEPDPETFIGDFENEAARSISAAVRRDYPRIARERGWQGRVELRVHFRKGGLVADVAVVRSSGFAVLDDQAVDLVKTSRLPELPQPLRGRDFYVSLPIEFRLQRN